MSMIHPSQLVRISPAMLNRYIIMYHGIGKVAWQIMKEIYKEEELIGKTLNGTSRGTMISPRRRQAILKAIEDHCEGSKCRQSQIAAADKNIVVGLRNMEKMSPTKKNLTSRFEAFPPKLKTCDMLHQEKM